MLEIEVFIIASNFILFLGQQKAGRAKNSSGIIICRLHLTSLIGKPILTGFCENKVGQKSAKTLVFMRILRLWCYYLYFEGIYTVISQKENQLKLGILMLTQPSVVGISLQVIVLLLSYLI